MTFPMFKGKVKIVKPDSITPAYQSFVVELGMAYMILQNATDSGSVPVNWKNDISHHAV